MGSAHPPLEYLISSSQSSLESFELSRLNAVANLRKELRQLVEEWVEAEIEARMARWVLETRRPETTDSQSLEPLPVLSMHASGPELAMGPVLPALDSRELQSASLGIAGPNHAPGCGRPSATTERPPSSTKRVLAKRNVASEGVADPPNENAGDGSRPQLRQLETASNSGAAAALQSLERVLFAGANVFHCDSEAPEQMPSGEPLAEVGQMHFSAWSATQGTLFDSNQLEPRIQLHGVHNRARGKRLSLLALPVQTSPKQVRDKLKRALSFPSSPARKRPGPFPQTPLYLPRAAAAS